MPDESGHTSGNDTQGSSTTGGGSSASAGKDLQMSGDSGLRNDSTENNTAETAQMVTSEQFDSAIEGINSELEVLNTSAMLLVVAIFFVAGILAVGTLIRSFEI